ncbi:MAG: magnesium/cobalt transporter CorA [Phycisphaerales bacterium]
MSTESPNNKTTGPIDMVGKAVGSVGRAIEHTLGVQHLGRRLRLSGMRRKPGAAPGIEHHDLSRMSSTGEKVYITCIDYSPKQVQRRDIEAGRFDAFLAEHRPDWCKVRWINIDGLTDMRVIEAMARKYDLHPLAIEDLLHFPQRPKVDAYGGDGEHQARLFIITHMLQMTGDTLNSEQISIFLGHNTVLTFQITRGDIWDSIRERIGKDGSRLRENDAGFLVYALLDAMVDYCFPILEQYGERLEDLEERILDHPDQRIIRQVHAVRRELLLLRREVWPMREMVQQLQREPHECMSENTRTYLRDVYDHTVQIIDFIETCREMAAGLAETYMTAMGNRMNEVMKVLTIIATIFIPITFLAGVYGMNFKHFPELDWKYGYFTFWGLCIVIGAGLLWYFRRKRWL